MTNFHRYFIPNGVIFITCVTRDRYPFLREDEDIQLFLDTSKIVQNHHPYELLSYVILPDHFHWLIRPENEDGNFSNILQSLKRNFTRNYKTKHEITSPLNLWQPRFWDHVIRNEDDMEKHINYIHWNPVKHGFVVKPEDWRYSTYRSCVQLGFYGPKWDSSVEPSNIAMMDFE